MGARARLHRWGTLGLALLLLAGCSGGGTGASPTTAPSGSDALPTASGGPTASPTASDEGFTRRDPGMSDGEALARLATPATGEVWFPTPVKIPTPSWALGDPLLDQEWASWYELGTRGDSTIVGFMQENIVDIFERSPGGTWQWLPYPSARQAVTGDAAGSYGYDAVPANTTVYYDSLTLPAEFTLATGEPLLVPDGDRGGLYIPGFDVGSGPVGTTLDTVGGYSILRYAIPVTFVWSTVYSDVEAPDGLDYSDTFYMLRTPYGTFIPLRYDAFGALTDVTWTIATRLTVDAASAYAADLNDIGCGTWERDHNTAVEGSADADWVQAGTNARGEPVYIMATTNPLADPLYASYVHIKTERGESVRTFADFLRAPAVVGYRSPDTRAWLAYLNGAYSARSWC